MWRILVVEDSPTNMMLTVEILGFGGHVAIEAVTGAAGIESARREHPDIILMDIYLPDMDGFEATKILKADPQTRDIPVIAVTADVRAGEGKSLLDAGFDGYLGKPISYKEFLAEVDAAVHRCRKEKSG